MEILHSAFDGQLSTLWRGILKPVSNIYDGAFYKTSQLLPINCFHLKLPNKYLTVSKTHLCCVSCQKNYNSEKDS